MKRLLLTLPFLLAACTHPNNNAKPPKPSDPIAGSATLIPGQLEAYPTIHNIGIQWLVTGDANNNATGTVEFREANTKDWQHALPLHRTPARPNQKVKFLDGLDKWVPNFAAYAKEHFNQNYLAGSIFNLKPWTKYEVRVSLHDPDGGDITKISNVTMREIPSVGPQEYPINKLIPRKHIHVKGGGDVLKTASENAKPGDLLLVHAGKYNGAFTISTEGTDHQPIDVVAAGDGEVLIDGGPGNNDKTNGITVTGANVRISGLSFRNFKTCIKAEKSAKNLVISHCKLEHFYNGITVDADDAVITDNSLHESYHTLDMSIKGGDRKSCHGIEAGRNSRGAVIAYNEISLVSDALHALGRDTDVHNNDVIFCIDDAIELDFGGPNIRIYDNRFSYTGQNGISFQPYIGGPAYILRNCVTGQKENCLKNRYDSDSAYFINNTFISRDNNGNFLPFGSFSRNNIFLVSPGKTRSAHIDLDPDHLPPNMDYDLFGPVGPNNLTVAEFSKQTAQEKHGLQAKSNDEVLAHPPSLPKEYDTPQWIPPEPFIKWNPATTRPHPDYSLAPNSPAINAGTPVANVTPPRFPKSDRALMQNPDAGALQLDAPLPLYGPRH